MKKALLVIVALIVCAFTVFFICYSQSQQEELYVKVVRDFLDFSYDGKLEEARKLTSRTFRTGKSSTYEINSEVDGKIFDFTQLNAMSEQKFRFLKVLDVQEGEYQTKILVLAKDKAFEYKLGFCLTKDIVTDKWKINFNRLYLDEWDFENSYNNDSCIIK